MRDDQLLLIEEQWAIVNGTHAQFLAEQSARAVASERLRAQLGHEPSRTEIEWAMLYEQLETFAANMQWGLYRNSRLAMGDILKRENSLEQALNTYLEVCYIDANGPNNCMLCDGKVDRSFLREFPPFDKEMAFIAPGVARYIRQLQKKLKIDDAAVRDRFVTTAERVRKLLRLKVAPSKAWRMLSSELNS